MDIPFEACIVRDSKFNFNAETSSEVFVTLAKWAVDYSTAEGVKANYKAIFHSGQERLSGFLSNIQGSSSKKLDLPTEKLVHSPLQDTKGIRLVQVHVQDTILSLTVRTYSASEIPPYVCLSYVWVDFGPMWNRGRDFRETELEVPHFRHADQVYIAINEKLFPTGPNLHAALLGLHKYLNGRPIWTDAICINQEDPGEKAIQVARMDEVHGAAEKVFIWLDRKCTERTAAMSILKAWPVFPDDPNDANIQFHGKKYATAKAFFDATSAGSELISWLNLLRIVTESWWSRVWAVQEFILAKDYAFLLRWGRSPWAGAEEGNGLDVLRCEPLVPATLGQTHLKPAQRLINGDVGLLVLSLVNHPLPRESYKFTSTKPIGNRLLDRHKAKKRFPSKKPDWAPLEEDIFDDALQPDWSGKGVGYPSWIPKMTSAVATEPLFLKEMKAQKTRGRPLYDHSWRVFHAASSVKGGYSLSGNRRALSVSARILDRITKIAPLPKKKEDEKAFYKSLRSWYPEYDAGGYLNSIAVIVFELVAKIPFTDPKQDMLSKFLIGIAKNATESFDEKDPRFVCWSWGIQAAAVERWNACHIDAGRLDREGSAVDGAIDIWLSTTALIAKLFQADLLGAYGPLWLSYDFIRAFKTHIDGDYTKHTVRQAQILAVAYYILLAGEAFAQDAKISSPERRYDLDAENWKLWASKLKEVSDTVDKSVRWDLKGKTQKAYEKMVELYPEAFASE
ncbi:Heterokaryon incompatibility protein 6, OR allele [Fusarium oxysporum f. sp. rapae]|uniref:Heterokaryon incompatibility protein 6, OR allele n=1 Tax=Fusarium oxysporum f. sp. rapae TaxID=485398 RepID=A0A8J5PKL8_FUSOX|nr:Heterokaryon incompatibility protein 6, OR allele [Fusarium oxysporum f. sp. rapae]